MDDLSHHQPAARLKRVLLGVLAVVALLIAASLLRDIRQAVEMRMRWERHPAVVTNTADPQWVELEVDAALLPRLGDVARPEYPSPSEDSKLRILLPAPPYAWYSVFDEVDIALEPVHPAEVAVLDFAAQAVPPLAKLAWLACLALVGWLLLRARWGEDLTWLSGQWVVTADTPLRAGAATPLATTEPLRETRASHQGVVFWSAFTGLAVLATVAWTIQDHAASPVETGSALLLSLGVFGLALTTAVGTFTRGVRHDATGLSDRCFFRTRRVPWKEIAGLRRVNLNEAAQRRYDSRRKNAGFRPQTLTVWCITDAQGQEILRFSEAMAPAEAFTALRRRIEQGLAESSPGQDISFWSSFSPSGATESVSTRKSADAILPPAYASSFVPPEFTTSPRSLWARANRRMAIGLIVMLLPFVLATGYTTWRSLWFMFLADSSIGTVVQKSTSGVPSVVVEYALPPTGKTLQLESAGSDYYANIALGDKIKVFYDPADPDTARLDLFLELWIAPLLLCVPTLILLLAAVLITRSVTHPFTTPQRRRDGKDGAKRGDGN